MVRTRERRTWHEGDRLDRPITMKSKVSGRCNCGNVTYEYVGEVGPANYCHCVDCRRSTGSAFNIGVRLDAAAFSISSVAPKAFTKRGDSGRELTRHFCAECGSPIYTSSPSHREYVYVKAGTLDDATIVEPTHQNWVVSAVAWSRIDDRLRSFERSRRETENRGTENG
jgi:hypothetical protein